MPAKKDTEYLSVSSRVRAMENRLLTRDKLEQMIDAADDAQALKVLADCGFGEVADTESASLEQALHTAMTSVYRDLAAILPDPLLLDLFRMKYDYHNAKVLLKSARVGRPAERLLLGGGRYDPAQLAADQASGSLGDGYSPAFRAALDAAAQCLADSGDAQTADMILDRAYYAEQQALALQCAGPFTQDYLRLSVDATNLRICVRCTRLDKDAAFLADALLDGGNVPKDQLVKAGGEAGSLFRSGPLSDAASLADTLTRPDGAPLTAFERECDDALMRFARACRRVPFGEEVVVGYLLALDAELTAVRIVMAGRRAGLEPDVTRQRLRVCYL